MPSRKLKEVYERLPIERKDKTLTEISGFTNFYNDPKAFRQKVIEGLHTEFGQRKKADICEIGCGCGDKLTYFYHLAYLLWD